jgi:uncharacterized protein (DUF1499 family)
VERLWLVPTFMILTLLLLGPALAFLHVLAPEAGFSLVVLAVLIGMVFGIGLAGASAFATVTNKTWRPRAVRASIVPLLVGLPALGLANLTVGPSVHDVATDPEHPLAFTAAVTAQSTLPEPDENERALLTNLQRAGYPDLGPLSTPRSPADAFARAKRVADELPHWLVTEANADTGRIEATVTSRLFHFVDDVVIQVTPDGAGSRIDLRSRSRVLRGDLGSNAANVRDFARAFAKE